MGCTPGSTRVRRGWRVLNWFKRKTKRQCPRIYTTHVSRIDGWSYSAGDTYRKFSHIGHIGPLRFEVVSENEARDICDYCGMVVIQHHRGGVTIRSQKEMSADEVDNYARRLDWLLRRGDRGDLSPPGVY